jgi:putative transposase
MPDSRDVLGEVLRQGAREMLARTIQAEVAEWIDAHAHLTDAAGRRQVVRNGAHPEREILTGLGPITVQQPRVLDRRPPRERETFTPNVLPPYLRRTKNIDEAIPWLYLKGISTGDFPEALQGLFGVEAKGLSANTVTRLKAGWEEEYGAWNKRSLKGKHDVYVWADGVHFNVRVEDDRQCILVLMGATADGKKELIAVTDGYRESAQSWKELLLDVKARGLEREPSLAIGDGALGFWKAMREVWHTTKEQRCWVYKTANVLDKLPKGSQPKAKGMLHEIYEAENRAAALKAFDLFVATYEAKYPKATECLSKDRDALLRWSRRGSGFCCGAMCRGRVARCSRRWAWPSPPPFNKPSRPLQMVVPRIVPRPLVDGLTHCNAERYNLVLSKTSRASFFGPSRLRRANSIRIKT